MWPKRSGSTSSVQSTRSLRGIKRSANLEKRENTHNAFMPLRSSRAYFPSYLLEIVIVY